MMKLHVLLDNGEKLWVDDDRVIPEIPEPGDPLPEVTSADDGKVLTVVDGEWNKAEAQQPIYEGVIFAGDLHEDEGTNQLYVVLSESFKSTKKVTEDTLPWSLEIFENCLVLSDTEGTFESVCSSKLFSGDLLYIDENSECTVVPSSSDRPTDVIITGTWDSYSSYSSAKLQLGVSYKQLFEIAKSNQVISVVTKESRSSSTVYICNIWISEIEDNSGILSVSAVRTVTNHDTNYIPTIVPMWATSGNQTHVDDPVVFDPKYGRKYNITIRDSGGNLDSPPSFGVVYDNGEFQYIVGDKFISHRDSIGVRYYAIYVLCDVEVDLQQPTRCLCHWVLIKEGQAV